LLRVLNTEFVLCGSGLLCDADGTWPSGTRLCSDLAKGARNIHAQGFADRSFCPDDKGIQRGPRTAVPARRHDFPPSHAPHGGFRSLFRQTDAPVQEAWSDGLPRPVFFEHGPLASATLRVWAGLGSLPAARHGGCSREGKTGPGVRDGAPRPPAGRP